MNETIIHNLNQHEVFLKNIVQEYDIPASRIKEAITYALFPGGKRLRPTLVYLCGELVNAPLPCLDIIAAAIELTHCYSLVHDDLPAMDNDDFRRGKPSCHRAFDEATAILVGDGLQALAVDILLTKLPGLVDPLQVITITRELVLASGLNGMVSGQSLDLSELHNPNINEDQLRTIHMLKTGRLILACITMVLAASCPTEANAAALRQYATHLGLVFQMQDDYLDKFGTINTLGKGRASDSANNKITFTALYSKNDLLQLINQHFQQAVDALDLFKENNTALVGFTRDLQQRTTGF